MFETDLPAYEFFQNTQWKENFRARRRFEWRLEAKASRALRKHGFCKADLWTKEEAAVAGKLLAGLQTDTKIRRARLSGVTHGDPDAWCWETSEVPVEEEVLRQARDIPSDTAEAQQEAHRVAQRLLGPWHRPAV